MTESSSLFGFSQRTSPANMQAEQALLGALLANNKAWNQVRDFLLPEHMADPVHGRILQAIMRRVEAGQLADAVTLKTDLENSGILEEVGGTKYLAQLLTAMVSPMLAGEYGRTIFDCWTRRKAIDLGTKFVNAAFGDDSDLTAADVIERHEDDIVALRAQSTASASRRRGPVTALDAFEELVAGFDDKRSNGVWSTGLTELDRIIGGGIAPDTLTYLIGDGGAGKTELCLQVGENVAMSLWDAWVSAGSVPPCPGVLYIMLGNMSRRQMIARTGARHSGVRLKTLRRGEPDLEEADRLVMVRNTLVRMPIEFVDDCPPTTPAVLGEMRRFAKRRPLALCLVDNFSDILSSVPKEQMFSAAVGGTKALKEQGARELGAAVWLLMHTPSSDEQKPREGEIIRPRKIPWNTKKDADVAVGITRPFKFLRATIPETPKSASEKGREDWALIRKKWQDDRESWPTGVRNVAELNPIKLREQDSDEADELARLYFDGRQQRFFDAVKQDAPASFDEGWGNT